MTRRKKPQPYSIVAEGNFRPLGEVRADSKKRVVLKGKIYKHYSVYQDEEGKILLAPMELIPAREAWLYRNPKALASLRQGIKDAEAGRIVRRPRLAKYVNNGGIILRPAGVFPVEMYSAERLQEFEREDQMTSDEKKRLRKGKNAKRP